MHITGQNHIPPLGGGSWGCLPSISHPSMQTFIGRWIAPWTTVAATEKPGISVCVVFSHLDPSPSFWLCVEAGICLVPLSTLHQAFLKEMGESLSMQTFTQPWGVFSSPGSSPGAQRVSLALRLAPCMEFFDCSLGDPFSKALQRQYRNTVTITTPPPRPRPKESFLP